MTEPIDVIFIASDSRSGSTLLDLALGQIAGYRSVGEVRYLWERGLTNNELCGCGVAFGDCPFWQKVICTGFDQLSESHVAEILALQRKVDHPRSVFRNPFFSPRRMTASFKHQRHDYQAALAKLYRGIHAADDCRFIIDSSKVPSHGLLLAAMDSIRLHVIHLVRDCRAVAFSMQRKKSRPEVTTGNAYLPTYPPWKTAVRWMLTNRACRWLEPRTASFTRVRYEDFIDQPLATLRTITNSVGDATARFDFLDGNVLELAPNHTVAGNPARFKTGRIELVRDDQWRDELPAAQRKRITFLARSQLRAFGYLDM